MGWWRLDAYRRYEKAEDYELRINLEGWKALKENWVLYMLGANGRRSWGPPGYSGRCWKRYGKVFRG